MISDQRLTLTKSGSSPNSRPFPAVTRTTNDRRLKVRPHQKSPWAAGRGHRKGFHFDARHGLLTAYQKRDQIRGTSKAEKAACLRPILANILFDALRRRV